MINNVVYIHTVKKGIFMFQELLEDQLYYCEDCTCAFKTCSKIIMEFLPIDTKIKPPMEDWLSTLIFLKILFYGNQFPPQTHEGLERKKNIDTLLVEVCVKVTRNAHDVRN